MKRMGTLWTVAAVLCFAQQPSPQMRSLQGTLRGEDGTVLAGGNIFLQRTPPNSEQARKSQWTVVSDSKGDFRFGNLPSGQFRLCGKVTATEWLNPCEWGSPAVPILIKDELVETRVNLVLKKGVRVSIKVEDKGNLLSLHEGKTPGAHLLLGVQNDAGIFTPATAAKSTDVTSRNYEQLVPLSTQAELTVNSRFFRLADSTGKTLSKGATSKFPLTPYATAGSPDQRPVFRLIITGGEQPEN